MLRGAGVLAPERIRGVETGACPHTAIRDDITANLLAIEDLEADFDPVDLVLVESGGDNLTATFSPALVDTQIFVLDVAGGGDVVRKGGPGISRADLLVVNKTDLAPYVGVDAELMVRQGGEARDGRPVLGTVALRPRLGGAAARLGRGPAARVPGRDAGSAGPRSDGGARPRSRSLPRLPPRTEPTPVSHTRLEVCRDPAGGRVRVLVRTDGPRGRGHLGIRVLHAGVDGARVAVLAEGALLVAGDDVSVGMRVGPGVRLDVVEPAGTVAFDMRGGSARWGVSVEVDDGGELVWRAEPFVVATGAVVDRELEVTLHGSVPRRCARCWSSGACARPAASCGNGFAPARRAGRCSPRTSLSTALAAGRRHRRPPGGRLGDRSRATSRRVTPGAAHRLELEGAGTVVRHLGAQTHTSPLEPFWTGRRRRTSRRAGPGMTGVAAGLGDRSGAAAAPGGRLVRRDVAQRDVGRGSRLPRSPCSRNRDLLPAAARRGVRLAPRPVGRAVVPPPRCPPLELSLGGDGDEPSAVSAHRLGPDVAGGETPQLLVPPGHWQAARLLGDEAVLVSCVVVPGFDFADFTLLGPA